MSVLTKLRTLCLNNDFVPLNTITAKRALKRTLAQAGPCDYCNGRGCLRCSHTGQTLTARAIEYYKVSIKDSKGREYPVPSVIVNNHYVVRQYRKVPFSKKNVLKRDKYTCQYCLIQLPAQDLTIDHVVPRSMWKGNGTPTCWTNVVACCFKCNSRKNNKTPEQAKMSLKKSINNTIITYKYPKRPEYLDMVIGLTHYIPSEWEPYLASIK